MADYRKWDHFVRTEANDSEEDEEESAESVARRDPDRAGKLLMQHEAMMRLVGWLTEAAPELSDKELSHLVRFVAVQDKVVCPDIMKRHAAIAEFLNEEQAPGGGVWKPPMQSLAALCHLAEQRTNAPAVTSQERSAFGRVLILAMSALNTLGACKREGGIDALLTMLEDDPNGQVAQHYHSFAYAQEYVRRDTADHSPSLSPSQDDDAGKPIDASEPSEIPMYVPKIQTSAISGAVWHVGIMAMAMAVAHGIGYLW